MAHLELRHVSASRRTEGGGSAPVLRDVSLAIPAGAAYALVGPSGSGKSTLLRLVNRLADPDDGEVLLNSVPTASLDVLDLRRRVGLVGQQPVMFEGTVLENLGFGPAQLGDAKQLDESAALALLDRVALTPDYLCRDARLLSVGEQQRVALARALANEPEMLLLDEPTSALDRASAERVIEALRTAKAELGLTLLLVTHVEAEIAAIADHIGHLTDGRLVEPTPCVGARL